MAFWKENLVSGQDQWLGCKKAMTESSGGSNGRKGGKRSFQALEDTSNVWNLQWIPSGFGPRNFLSFQGQLPLP